MYPYWELPELVFRMNTHILRWCKYCTINEIGPKHKDDRNFSYYNTWNISRRFNILCWPTTTTHVSRFSYDCLCAKAHIVNILCSFHKYIIFFLPNALVRVSRSYNRSILIGACNANIPLAENFLNHSWTNL